MSMTWIGIIALAAMAMIGIPIYIAILTSAVIILVVGVGNDPIIEVGVMASKMGNTMLLAIPLFVLLGQVLAYGGGGKSLVRMLNAFMGHLPGGPAYALILANIVLATMCAEPIAAVAAFGPLMIPIMIGLGYSEVFAVGLLIVSASLSPLIPPNIIAIIYAFIASPVSKDANGLPLPINVKTVWTGCIIPGLIIALLLCVLVYFHSRRGHFKKMPPVSWGERWSSLKEAWPMAITPAAVLGPLYLGWATPTEVSAIGVCYVILISLIFYRGLTLKSFGTCCVTTMHILGSIFLIVMAATLLTLAITYAKVPQDITTWITDMGLNWVTFMLLILIVFILMGMFLDPTAIIIVMVPMLMGTVNNLEISVIMFGVFTILAVNLGNITPPYGLAIFASQSILNKSYSTIVRACVLFYPALVIGMLLVAFIPSVTTWLPDYTGW